MRCDILAIFPLAASAINIISSNDDGWAEANIRALFESLGADHSVVVSAPAENQSGKGSMEGTPTALTEACEFNSCPSGSPAVGFNASEPRLGYVNSYPVTSIQYGIDTRGPEIFDGPPDLAVTGPNVGSNIGLTVFISGTVGAATYAAKNGIPAIAFSGASGSPTSWDSSRPHYSEVYADLATNLTNQVIAAGKPYLPEDTWLNVNFGKVSDKCATPADFSFVLSRIHVPVPLVSGDDVATCGRSRLPNELEVSLASGCYASVSVGIAASKRDADAEAQGVVLKKLGNLLTCLP
ncbi:Survival protein SurE-like phosphatase/nucleotidase [Penicillium italicum]|uniref:Survival protein SurE-like phosphatase/nucleotidase n=1 Tax=Penicillium italicum TaxID=40296 RepID=A0A0A2L4K0_PENIT|nr:Survival protein SurE-like phosphatase/nucleotidase [Penicillium italicum]